MKINVISIINPRIIKIIKKTARKRSSSTIIKTNNNILEIFGGIKVRPSAKNTIDVVVKAAVRLGFRLTALPPEITDSEAAMDAILKGFPGVVLTENGCLDIWDGNAVACYLEFDSREETEIPAAYFLDKAREVLWGMKVSAKVKNHADIVAKLRKRK